LECPSKNNPVEKCGGKTSINIVSTACVRLADYNSCLFALKSTNKEKKAKKVKKLSFKRTHKNCFSCNIIK
jgi:hypothetical protein